MKICQTVHQIRIDFCVMPEIRRYVYVYLIEGRDCYLIDAGTADDAFVYRYRGLRAFLRQRRQYVLVDGVQAPVICPPGLTHTMVDVTGLDCHPGDTVTIPHDLVLTGDHVLRRYTEGA